MIMSLMMKLMYPCEKIREFVFDYAEGRLNPFVAMRFKAHISKCRDCNEYVRLYKMAADIRKFRRVNPPPGKLVDKTMDFLQKEGLADFSDEPKGHEVP